MTKSANGAGEFRGKVSGLTVSIGGASCPAHATDTEGLVHAADIAMIVAKDAGKNRVVVWDDLPGSLRSDKQLA